VTLTVSDIDRWSAEQVREVFHAGTARGQATLEASRQLSALAVFDSWEGATAEARKHINASIRQDLDSHGNESLTVAQNMVNALQTYADRITTPDIRRPADRMVTINQDMFEQWKTWVAQSRARSSEAATPTSSDKQFGNQFAANARKLKLVHAELTAACPN
jgi:hypothetical protein